MARISAYRDQWAAVAANFSHADMPGGKGGGRLNARQSRRMITSASTVMPIDLCWLTSVNWARIESASSILQAQTNCAPIPAATSQCSAWATDPYAVGVFAIGIFIFAR